MKHVPRSRRKLSSIVHLTLFMTLLLLFTIGITRGASSQQDKGARNTAAAQGIAPSFYCLGNTNCNPIPTSITVSTTAQVTPVPTGTPELLTATRPVLKDRHRSRHSGGNEPITPTKVFVANDSAAHDVITAFVINNAPFTGSCTWKGDVIATMVNFTWTNDPSKRVACVLQTSRQLATSDNGNHTGTVKATMNRKIYQANVTINVGETPTTPPPNHANTLIGSYGSPPHVSPGNPNIFYSIGGTYMGPCPGTGSLADRDSDSGGVIIAYVLVDPPNSTGCGMTDWHQAALGGYNSIWHQAIRTAAGHHYANGLLYAIRIQNEWEGLKGCGFFTPYFNKPGSGCKGSTGSGVVPPADWISAIEQFANMVHQNFPGVKIIFQAPNNNGSDIAYWPVELAKYVDLTGYDYYFDSHWGPTEASQAWTNSVHSPVGDFSNAYGMVAFAAMNGKPIATDEFCDTYNDGYLVPRTAWLLMPIGWANLGYWNDSSAGPHCGLSDNPAVAKAIQNMFDPYPPYTGTIFSPKPAKVRRR